MIVGLLFRHPPRPSPGPARRRMERSRQRHLICFPVGVCHQRVGPATELIVRTLSASQGNRGRFHAPSVFSHAVHQPSGHSARGHIQTTGPRDAPADADAKETIRIRSHHNGSKNRRRAAVAAQWMPGPGGPPRSTRGRPRLSRQRHRPKAAFSCRWCRAHPSRGSRSHRASQRPPQDEAQSHNSGSDIQYTGLSKRTIHHTHDRSMGVYVLPRPEAASATGPWRGPHPVWSIQRPGADLENSTPTTSEPPSSRCFFPIPSGSGIAWQRPEFLDA